MHVSFFFKISHSPIYSFIVHSLNYHLSTFLSNLPAGHSKNEAVAISLQRIDSLTVSFSHPKWPFCIIHVFLFSEFSINSTILHENQYYLQHLHRFLASTPEVGEDYPWFLCYRATSDGWSNTIFHQKCYLERNTATIMRKVSYVFGGHTDISWGKILYWLLSIFSTLFLVS